MDLDSSLSSFGKQTVFKKAVVRMSTEGGFGGTSSSDAQQSLQSFWPRVMEEIRNLTVKDFRVQELPLARIKKIMKLDEDVKMISAEAPVLFAKAAQIFITELTLRAWIHTEDNKRRTLQRNDIAMAITKFDQFDFLIDIVPRDELKPPKRQEEVRQSVTPAEPVQYYFTLAQQPAAVQVQGQQQGQQTTSSTTTIQPGQIIIAQPQQGQTTPVTMQVGEGQQVQIVQAQPQGQAQQAQSSTGQTMQVMQQIITNTGEIQQIPVQLNAGQLQYIRLAQPVSGTQVVQGQIQTLATSAPQVCAPKVQGLGRGPARAGFWLERRAQQSLSCHLTLQQETPPHPSHLFTPKDRRGLVEDWIQSVSLTILFSRDKEMQRKGNLKDACEESLMYVCTCLTRGSTLTDCLIVSLSFHL
ncbi:nuclear transcription factor gamma variant [Lynx pardinus]|uniref:Nuclear transcription factor Y subunit gamma n=1 Tax=Lynx pardinus TaxID=191816 RepID=A0A485MPL4_LYNPA|nr:nuclear transcription factor gamma variant [Lynx pardinus]